MGIKIMTGTHLSRRICQLRQNGHFHIILEVKDLDGNQTTLRFPIPFSPSDFRWRLAFRTQLRHKIFEQNANTQSILEGTIFQ